jgi:hypothetical protein
MCLFVTLWQLSSFINLIFSICVVIKTPKKFANNFWAFKSLLKCKHEIFQLQWVPNVNFKVCHLTFEDFGQHIWAMHWDLETIVTSFVMKDVFLIFKFLVKNQYIIRFCSFLIFFNSYLTKVLMQCCHLFLCFGRGCKSCKIGLTCLVFLNLQFSSHFEGLYALVAICYVLARVTKGLIHEWDIRFPTHAIIIQLGLCIPNIGSKHIVICHLANILKFLKDFFVMARFNR